MLTGGISLHYERTAMDIATIELIERIDLYVEGINADPQPSYMEVLELLQRVRSLQSAANAWQEKWKREHPQPLTKWDLLDEHDRSLLQERAFEANGTGRCSGCGMELPTEADFAKHLIITDLRYYNVGSCPAC